MSNDKTEITNTADQIKFTDLDDANDELKENAPEEITEEFSTEVSEKTEAPEANEAECSAEENADTETDEAPASVEITVLDGDVYRDMVVSAANALENEKDEINNLNVFPVPDGDTGVNMSLTMSPARNELKGFKGSVADVSDKVAKTFLRAARGNSGVILSSFFKGMAKGFKDCVVADASSVAHAFKQGVDTAYKAVMTPTEGTILTVMRACADKAMERISEKNPETAGDIEELFTEMLEVAGDTLAKTPDMLPALKQANVVDAGGSGFVAVLEGMLAALKKQPISAKTTEAMEEVARRSSADFTQFETENIVFPYCTECIVTKAEEYAEEGSAEELHRFVMAAGDSAVFVEDSDIIKIHVHTSDPGRVLSEAIKYGSLFTVKVENMKNQHTGLIAEHEKQEDKIAVPISADPEKPYGFVSVCSGTGIRAVFTDLGVDNIVIGGQTMNPSTDDMLKAIALTPAETVYVLPNNSNIYLVAK
ncbi:MAG: DAK2 domain-containing protein, partial [Clostridia bacterium]|nr:DAK2 domain-containing protein [Clostridia bacterium]